MKYFGYTSLKSLCIKKMKEDYKITFIRGATTASGNSMREIEVAVVELIDELISRNNLIKTNILSITFTAVNVMDNMFVLIRLFREINSSINSTTATSISLIEFPDAVVAPRINVIL